MVLQLRAAVCGEGTLVALGLFYLVVEDEAVRPHLVGTLEHLLADLAQVELDAHRLLHRPPF